MELRTKADIRKRFKTDLLFSTLQLLGYEVKKNVLILNLQIGAITFQHRDEFSIDISADTNSVVIDKLATFYGIVKAFEYTQHFLCSEFIVHESSLTHLEEKFWQDYFDRYSLELYCTENIPLHFLTKLTYVRSSRVFTAEKPAMAVTENEDVLLGVGGGKDAIYAYEVLEQSHIPTALFFTYATEADLQLRLCLTQMMAKKYKRPYYSLKRVENVPEVMRAAIDEQRKTGIKPSAPAASANAIRLAMIALCKGYQHISTCNEKSSDFGNTYYFGQEVNHQYSKSLEFERTFNLLIQSLTPSLSYFSILKPMYEVRIAQGFATLKDYHGYFNSCNRDHQSWCLDCSKCAFVFALLAGFLKPKEIIHIFGENLFDKKSLELSFLELMGIVGVKPFECVGEKEEIWIAMARALQLGHHGRMLDVFKDNIAANIVLPDLEEKYLKVYQDKNDHIIPKKIFERIKWL